MYIPSHKHKVIKIVRKITNIEQPTMDDFEKVINIFQNLILSGYSSEDINIHFNLGYTKNNFASVLRNCFNITLKTRKESVINYCAKNGTLITDDKRKYYKNCSFKFKEFDSRTPGIELLKSYDFVQGQKQKGIIHLHRDHMISKKYGWDNNVDYNIISHPANCQILLSLDNQIKSTKSSITLDELIIKIHNW